MDDDLDTPAATAILDELAGLALGTHDPRVSAEAGAAVRELGSRILGLRLASASVPVEPAAA